MLWGVHKLHWWCQAMLESLEEGMTQGNASEPLKKDMLWGAQWFGKAGWEAVWKIKGPAGLWDPIGWGSIPEMESLIPSLWDPLVQVMWSPFLSQSIWNSLWCESSVDSSCIMHGEKSLLLGPSHRLGVMQMGLRWKTFKENHLEDGNQFFPKTCWKLLERHYKRRGWEETKIVVIKPCGRVEREEGGWKTETKGKF